eukprot:SAG22_NODE_215_length_14950_cov_4.960676_1_plen_689_part_10
MDLEPSTSQQVACLNSDDVLLSVQCCSEAETDCANARVVGLGLSGRHLHGSLPDALGRFGALRTLQLHDNFLVGSIPASIGKLYRLQELRVDHNQLSMQGVDSLFSILSAMPDLQTLALGMSDEVEDLMMTVITPAPPLNCRVGGGPCGLTISMRTRLGLQLNSGGLFIAVAKKADEQSSVVCTDMMDGTYACVLPDPWISRQGQFDIVISAGGEEFTPIRKLVDPITGMEQTVSSYPDLAVIVKPIACNEVNSHPEVDGSRCVCTVGHYRRDYTGGFACEHCPDGEQPAEEGNRCEACPFGTHSSDGAACTQCEPGFQPSRATSAISCEMCDEKSVSSDGIECHICPADQQADAARTSCVCPVNMYNSSLHGRHVTRCLGQGLRGRDTRTSSVCEPCNELACAQCGGAHGLKIRPGFAVASEHLSWLVFKCPFEGACLQDEVTGHRCVVGHTGLLCAECVAGYGLDRDRCIACSGANSSPYAAGVALIGSVCLVLGLIYLWTRYKKDQRRPERSTGISVDEMSEHLTANPLQPSPQHSSFSNSTTESFGSRRELALAQTAQRSTDLFILLRIMYQPVRIIVGYIQVVTQFGPVLDLEFPRYIRTLIHALKPFMIDLQSILQLDCLSAGALSYYSIWIARVFVIPALMLGMVGLQYCYERRRVGHSTPNQLKINALSSELHVMDRLVSS